MKKTNSFSLEDLDLAIKKALSDLVNNSKNLNKPISLNIQFSDQDEDDFHEEIENIIYDKNKMFLTLYMPYTINQLKFYIDENSNILVIRSFDDYYFKEFYFNYNLKKDSLNASYKNNILELEFEKE
ncbi:MAG: hypothetical protein PHR26_02100 [Candidatus ainarchaeum sp.]|nr:hypothetical protein [Candidatus ainarchaeum sp.]MDD3975577.1 hypothetical protein [Candidatus ainarchaeum sp.]